LGLGSAGWGAWEIGVRYSKFDASDFDTNATAVNNSTTLSSNDVNSYTAGIKWITDPNTRFMLNYVYTDFNKDISGIASAITSSGVPLHNHEKAVNVRAQFDF
jgi:phosphate-selective porin OprO/OprP